MNVAKRLFKCCGSLHISVMWSKRCTGRFESDAAASMAVQGLYHWRQLPQVSRQNTSFVATNVCLARQNVCRDKYFSVRNRQCASDVINV